MTAIVTFTPNPALDISTTVPRILADHKMRCTPPRHDPGGGGINVARVVQRLGGDVTAVYPRGGLTGELFSRLVARENVRCRTSEIADETRQDFAAFDDESGQQFRFVLPGPVVTEAEWRTCLDTLGDCVSAAGFVVASGSLPPGTAPDLYARANRVVKSANGRFLLDSSGPALRAALAEGVWLIKPSLRELSETVDERLDGEADWIRACAGLVRGGRAAIVTLSLGHLGALLVAQDRVIRATPPPVTPLGSSGAGDSFLGALVWGLAAGRDLADALCLGVAAGTSAVQNPGTELAHADDIHRLVKAVTVREL